MTAFTECQIFPSGAYLDHHKVPCGRNYYFEKRLDSSGCNRYGARLRLLLTGIPSLKSNKLCERNIMGILQKLFSSKKQNENGKLGRNDSCWCGSGKKYKRCHLDTDAKKRSSQIADAAIHGGR